MRLDYIPVWSNDEIMKRFQEESKDRQNDFVECLVFSNSTGVIMTGRYSDGFEANKVTMLYTIYGKQDIVQCIMLLYCV